MRNLGLLIFVSLSVAAFPSLGLIDVDTNGNGIPDAISVGLRVSMSGAALATPPVAW